MGFWSITNHFSVRVGFASVIVGKASKHVLLIVVCLIVVRRSSVEGRFVMSSPNIVIPVATEEVKKTKGSERLSGRQRSPMCSNT